MPDHEVVIVGAGPVGLLLACLLVQDGIDVVVCERRAAADPRTRAIGIHRPGLDALDAVELGPSVLHKALRLDGGDVISRGRTLASLSFTSDRPILVLPQQQTDALLRDRLRLLSPGALRSAHAVRGVRDEGPFVRLSVDTDDGVREITGALVVAADGVRSARREELGIAWRPRAGAGAYAMADAADVSDDRRARLYCEPDGLVESFPLPAGRRRWVVRRGSADAEPLTAAAFLDVVETRTGVRPEIPDEVVPSLFGAAQHTARSHGRGRVVLLGDARHEISPIGGQGMNLGWMDAVRLAETIVRDRARGSYDFRGYGRRTRRSARVAQRRSAFYMSMGRPADGASLVARDILIRTLGSAPLRRASAGMITMRGI
jgi:2-polyprenyl-6-methoxyphenol hydroxylase-like FAD-dependent oxidoreductase